MEPLTIAALISGGISAAGSIANYFINRNRNQVLDNRDDTAIQRRIADLKAAGLNPLLAAGTGANTTTGMSMGVDTSQVGNFMQNLYELKNNRESYKQNQLYTKLMEVQLADARSQYRVNQELNAMTYGLYNGGSPFNAYDKLGNFKGYNFSEDMKRNIYDNFVNFMTNESNFNNRQSAFNLKTQGYNNYFDLVNKSMQPLLDVAGLALPYKFKKVK